MPPEMALDEYLDEIDEALDNGLCPACGLLSDNLEFCQYEGRDLCPECWSVWNEKGDTNE